jgi:glutamate synthase domain-containing protein 2/glutamate synthase domain-containing protein 1/glutamate synthase domain-containing protein 3
VGAICHLKGEKSHYIVEKALEILVNLTHRGACGCDALTGDGAGILLQMPDKFLRKKAAEQGVDLPPDGQYAAGLVFLPHNHYERETVEERFEAVIKEEGQVFLGWRNMPLHNRYIGDVARKVEPTIRMILIGQGDGVADQSEFNRKLFVIRKVMENYVRTSKFEQKSYFYVPSLSSQTLCYKGLLLADQVGKFYEDLTDPDMISGLALVHQRYSTNTFPTWDLAQPFRFLCHNGEINTVRGNTNWLNTRQFLFASEKFGDDIEKIFPVATAGASDSAILDNALELLYHTGRSLPHAMMMLIPEAWQNHETMSDDKKAFYEYHSCMMEPWDGPASIPFTDGKCMGAVLDRNGLRPSRYTVTKDGFVVMGSETGVIEIDPENVEYKGRLEPGKMFLVDIDEGRIIGDDEIKSQMAARSPYRQWLNDNLVEVNDLPTPDTVPGTDFSTLLKRQQLFGYTLEDLKVIVGPMASSGKEPIGSMGNDTPLAVLSDRSQLLYNYFKQLFAQVTNPPLDAIREQLVTSLTTNIGAEGNLFVEAPEHSRQLKLTQPILTNANMARIKALDSGPGRSITLDITYDVAGGGDALKAAVDALQEAAVAAVDDGNTIIVLSDRNTSESRAPVPALLAVAAVHHQLIRLGKRTRCGIVVESGEPREVHHFAVLFAYGCGGVNPYVAIETLDQMLLEDRLEVDNLDDAVKNYIKAIGQGLLKVLSKMGISTLHSYRGAQILEALGLAEEFVNEYFTGTASRIGGIGLSEVAEEMHMRHAHAYPPQNVPDNLDLDVGGVYQWRRNGERHLFNPLTVAKLQQACREDRWDIYQDYATLINDQTRALSTLRGMFEFNSDRASISLDEVEPWTEIAKRFKTGAMSYGSISAEAHETLAIAMNRIGGKSNSGEGGEDPRRFERDENGDWRCSAIKQVASGRFGVSSHYLVNAQEIQIKMAQGAKPGEGGQLPGKKVWPWIAKCRNSTPFVPLISPPPHHDIYSIEDLAQLIHDLKNANNKARINVKLVAEVGVGTVAAGVSKGKADVVLISGWDGGTGASPETSLKHAGLPWELGLAETHQTLVLNDLRSRIVVECDGQMKTGRDVAIACLLGAEEFGVATAALVVTGCVMMRVCHLDTCPVGIATQNPELRAKYTGQPDHVVNFFRFMCEEIRQIMADLGFRTIDEMVGQSQVLNVREAVDHWKAKGLDFSRILAKPEPPEGVGIRCTEKQDHGLADALDNSLIEQAKPALERGEKVVINQRIVNVNRTVGTMLSAEVSRAYGAEGLPDDTITINCEGSAGQSFSAFGARGITFRVSGDGNDYFGKGLSGAKLSVRPPENVSFKSEENVIIGNVALYGATAGEMFARGKAGERFCVRNSGAIACCEGVGDHGCEYMTGGRAVILGPTGRNFGAGMSGGVAYVFDEAGDFGASRCNHEMVDLEDMSNPDDQAELRDIVTRFHAATGSEVAARILNNWEASLSTFVKVMPRDYKAALERMAQEQAGEQTAEVQGV